MPIPDIRIERVVPAAGRHDAMWCRLGYDSVSGTTPVEQGCNRHADRNRIRFIRSLVTVTR